MQHNFNPPGRERHGSCDETGLRPLLARAPLLALILTLPCDIGGCTRAPETKDVKGPKEEPTKERLVAEKVTVAQGSSSSAIMLVGREQPHMPHKIEGETGGVTARIDKSMVFVDVAKDARVGDVELTVKNAAGKKIASLTVTVTEPDVGLKFHLDGRKRVRVEQNGESVIKLSVIRRSEYVLASAGLVGEELPTSLAVTGRFQGDLKLEAEVTKGGKGLSVQFDPATVKGSENTSKLTFRAAGDADLGEAVVRLTATTADGRATVSLLLEVEVVARSR